MNRVWLLLFSFTVYAAPQFVIIVPSYNNERYARRNLDSLINQQTSQQYTIKLINDCSTDSTGSIMDEYAKNYHFITVQHNKERRGAMENTYNAVMSLKDDQIAVIVDGDDSLAHNKVLQRLEKEYSDPNLWVTYGQFVFYPSGNWGTTYEIPNDALINKQLRTLTYVAQHLRTFKAGLFKKIRKEDLMLNGKFYEVNADMAVMIPLLEMAGPAHSRFIGDILYIYNYTNPLSDYLKDAQPTLPHQSTAQAELEKVIRALPPYEAVDTL